MKANAIKRSINKWCAESHVELTATHMYSPAEWKKRGEDYCNNALLVITTEDDLYGALNNGGAARDSFGDLLDKLGLHMEYAYSWMIGLYSQ